MPFLAAMSHRGLWKGLPPLWTCRLHWEVSLQNCQTVLWNKTFPETFVKCRWTQWWYAYMHTHTASTSYPPLESCLVNVPSHTHHSQAFSFPVLLPLLASYHSHLCLRLPASIFFFLSSHLPAAASVAGGHLAQFAVNETARCFPLLPSSPLV